MTAADVLKLIKEKEAKFVDLRFTDTIGKEQHVTIPTRLVDEGFFKDGKMFDGSSIAGWKGINESDMILMPDPSTALIDPFFEETTVSIRCDVVEPNTTDRKLILNHRILDGMALAQDDTAKVLQHVADLWGYDVKLSEIDENGDVLGEHTAQPRRIFG